MGRNRIFTRNDNHQIVVSEGKAAAGTMKMFRGSTTGISLHSINDFIGTVPPLSVLIWLAFTTCQTFIPFRDGLSLETMVSFPKVLLSFAIHLLQPLFSSLCKRPNIKCMCTSKTLVLF
jgi:hypothetical protein